MNAYTSNTLTFRSKLHDVGVPSFKKPLETGAFLFSPSYTNRMQIDQKQLEQFCKKWKVQQLAIFGSALREDFSDKSDVDVLISFQHSIAWGFEIAEIVQELSQIFKRPVDLVSKRSIEASKNSFKRDEILKNCKVIYDKAA